MTSPPDPTADVIYGPCHFCGDDVTNAQRGVVVGPHGATKQTHRECLLSSVFTLHLLRGDR